MEKILVGAGHDRGYKTGYTTIDIDIKARPDILGDAVVELSKFDNDSIDEIASYHFIEHVKLDKAKQYLQTCYDKLKEGGKLITEFLDMKERCRRVANGEDNVIWGIFGDSSRLHYGHQYGYTETSFKRMIERLGFRVIKTGGSASGHTDSVCIAAEKISSKELRTQIVYKKKSKDYKQPKVYNKDGSKRMLT